MLRFHAISNRVDEACDEFEQQWKSGSQAYLEQYLPPRADPEYEVFLFELSSLELEYRRQRGEIPYFAEYVQRFPNDLLVLAELDFPLGEWSTSGPQTALPDVASFQLSEQVGWGTFGTVWRAWDSQLERTVALKLPRFGYLGQEGELHRFLGEAQAAARLRHPNIVSVFSVGREKGIVYIAAEFIDGPTLEQWLKTNRPTFLDAAKLCLQLADAMAHAHSNGVVHRDVKPANILMDGAGVPHITDFGLAKQLDKPGSTLSSRQILGTVGYMSPEQAAGHSKHVTPSSDVYSLGVILYEMLAGRLPFAGDPQTVLRCLLTQDPDWPSQFRRDIPAGLESICLTAVMREPASRYPTGAEFAADLRAFIEGAPVKARRFSRIRRRVMRSRRIVITSLIASSCLLPALAYCLRPSLFGSDGKCKVHVVTDPPGANVIAYPRDPRTRIPDERAGVSAKAPTPTTVRLSPGEYLVVAYLEGTGRFHEVDRTVPSPNGEVSVGGTNNKHWEPMGDGEIRWPTITIPPPEVTSTMPLLRGKPSFTVCGLEDPNVSPRTYRIPAFHIATREFTVAEFSALRPHAGPNDLPPGLLPTAPFIPRSLDFAIHWAEEAGGRLPSDIEYEYAAAQAPTISPPVIGLLAAPGEWTDSPPLLLDEAGRVLRILQDPRWYGIACGMPSPAEDAGSSAVRNTRQIVAKYSPNPSIGFRMVRSYRPRLEPEDFVQCIDRTGPSD